MLIGGRNCGTVFPFSPKKIKNIFSERREETFMPNGAKYTVSRHRQVKTTLRPSPCMCKSPATFLLPQPPTNIFYTFTEYRGFNYSLLTTCSRAYSMKELCQTSSLTVHRYKQSCARYPHANHIPFCSAENFDAKQKNMRRATHPQ